MAGMIANRLDLKGRNLVIDAACASSLIALEIAMDDLLKRKSDVALIGGVQISTVAPIHMIFTQLGALSRSSHLRPFDKDADGTMLGEGIGMMVLKRHEDAVRDGHRIYAVIKGVGSSSDGRGLGLLAPRVEGEELALRRAYEAANFSPKTIELMEAHGTGIPLGDATEIQALRRVFGSRDGGPSRCALGTVKSMIGHLIPAAGIAGLIKATLALYHKVYPPTLFCEEPNPDIEIEKTPFYINTETRPWIHGNCEYPRRAGVSSFGFGGINAHVLLEEHTADSEAPTELCYDVWESELCILQGETRDELIKRCEELHQYLSRSNNDALTNIAYTVNQELNDQSFRLSIVATSSEDLRKKLMHAIERLKDPKRARIKERSGIYFFEQPLGRKGKLAFLFPGEGSQYIDMLSDLCLYFPEVRSCFDLLDRAFADHPRNYPPSQAIFPSPTNTTDHSANDKMLWGMDFAVDTVIAADRALFRLLSRFGIKPQAVVGHSSGEFMALEAAGVVGENSDQELIPYIVAGNKMIERFTTSDEFPETPLVAVGAVDRGVLSEVVRKSNGNLLIAMENCSNQTILCVNKDAMEGTIQRLSELGAICQTLPFSRPYHTPLFKPACDPLSSVFEDLRLVGPKFDIYSCMTAARMPADPEEIRRLATEQWANPVRFQETIETMYDEGFRIFLEVGPKSNLTGFVRDILSGKTFLAMASNVHHRSGITQLNHTLGLLAAHFVPLRLDHLYASRMPTKLDLSDAEIDTTEDRAPKHNFQLNLALALLDIDREEIAALQGHEIRDSQSQKHPFSTPRLDAVSQKSSFEAEKTVEKKNHGNSPNKLDTTENSDNPNPEVSQASDAVMQAYFQTMGDFLLTQQDIMRAYFAGQNHSDTPIAIDQANTHTPSVYEPAISHHGKPMEKITSPEVYSEAHITPHEETREYKVEAEKDSAAGIAAVLGKEEIERVFLTCISEKTGYPVDMLDPDQNLEADLGIDSIKRLEILGALLQQIGSVDETMTEQLSAAKTSREIVSLLAIGLQENHPDLEVQSTEQSEDAPEENNRDVFGLKDASSRLPFIGKVTKMKPGREAMISRQLDLEKDLFLKDHTLGGRVSQTDETLLALPVVPFSMSLEMMAEAASQLFPDKLLVGMRDIRAHNWLVLEGPRLQLQIDAKARQNCLEADAQLWIMESASSQKKSNLALEGTIIFDDTYPKGPGASSFSLQSARASAIPPEQFYPQALFHGPSFRSVFALNRCGTDGVEALLKTPPKDHLFRCISNPHFLSDPVLLDGTGQTIGLWAANYLDNYYVIFPVGLAEAQFYTPPAQEPLSVTCQAHTALDGDTYVRSNIDLVSTDGSFCAQLIGLQHKRMNMPEILHLFRGSREVMLSTPWQAPLEQFASSDMMTCCRFDPMGMNFSGAEGHVLRAVVAHIILSRHERMIWAELSGSEMSRTEWLLARVAGKETVRLLLRKRYGLEVWSADIEILTDDNGKLLVNGEWISQIGSAPSISLAHSEGMAVALAADGAEALCCGVAMEQLREPDKASTRLAFTLEERESISALLDSDAEEWTIRVLCAKEAMAKALGKGVSNGLRDIKLRDLDSKTGFVTLEVSGQMALEFSQLAGQALQAYSICEEGFAYASAVCEEKFLID
jgi:acyl transferase domain-containing protein/phosphopantetheinyl transferase